MYSLIFSLFVLFSISFSQQDSEEPLFTYNSLSDMAVERTGFCNESSDPLCIPYKNFTFEHIWSQYPPEVITDLVNQKINKDPKLSKKIEAKIIKNGQTRLFAKETIENQEILSSFLLKDSLSCSSINLNLFNDDFIPLKKYRRGLPSLSLPEKDKEGILKFFNMVINLLLHLYNLEYSKIKEQILLLPRSLDQYEFLQYTPYEIENLMIGDDLRSKLLDMITYFKEGYKLFKETIITSWSKEIVNELFHVEEFSYPDFTYCLSIYLMRYNLGVLPNIFHNNLQKEFNKSINLMTFEFVNKTPIDFDLLDEDQIDSYKLFKITAQKKYEVGDEIIIDYRRFYAEDYLMSGEFNGEEDTLENECFLLFFLNEESSKKYNEPVHSCVNRKMIFHYYVFSNYINLIGFDFSDCNKLLKQLPNRNISFDHQRDQFIYENCVHPEWKTDFFSLANKQLEDRVDNFQHNLKKINDYHGFRIEKGLPARRSDILIKYFKLKLKLIGILREEMKKYIKINEQNRNSKLKKENLTEKIDL